MLCTSCLTTHTLNTDNSIAIKMSYGLRLANHTFTITASTSSYKDLSLINALHITKNGIQIANSH